MTNQLALKGGVPCRTTAFSAWPVVNAEDEEVLLDVLKSGNWSFTGPKELEFARQFASYCGVGHGQCVSNGTVSLEISLRALGIGPGDEVIVPALTWMATALAVVCTGAVPVFADIDEKDWCIDPRSINAKITSKTKAIIPVHLYSQMANMDEICKIAKKHSLYIIEDCAHAHGSQWKGQYAGSMGQMGSYSFQQSKSMTSGEGGIIITNSQELAEKIYGLKNCGRPMVPDAPTTFGGNFRITEFQAVLLSKQLERFPEQLITRNRNVELLEKKLAGLKGITILPKKKEVTQRGMYGLSIAYDNRHFKGLARDLFIRAIKAEGIPFAPPYDVVFKAGNWTSGKKIWKFEKNADPAVRLGLNSHAPVAEKIARESGVVLPHYLFLGNEQDMDDIARALEKVQRHVGELTMDSWKHSARSILKKIGI